MSDPQPNIDPLRLHRLTSRLCDQALEPEDAAALQHLLSGNPENLAKYCALTSLHLDLSQELRHSVRVAPVQLGKSTASTWQSRRKVWQTPIAAIAAALLVGVTLWLVARPSDPTFTARIVSRIDSNRGPDREGASQPETLDVGHVIDLQQGLLIVEFASGAEVMLEAPAQFTVLAKDRGRLGCGKLSADVGKRGRGFVVDVLGYQIEDLGTKFGVAFDATGNCEAHVFEGRVVVRTGKQSPSWEQWKLSSGEAIRFGAGSSPSQRMAAQPTMFVHADRFSDPRPSEGSPNDRLRSRNDVALWLRADSQLQLDEADQVIGWGNLAQADNTGHRHAWQANKHSRPKYVWAETLHRAALRFDGGDHLMVAPFSTDGDVTCVCVFRAESDSLPGCVLDLGSAPGVHLDESVQSRLPKDRIVVAVVSYEQASNRRTLHVNGQPVSWPIATDLGSSGSSKVIGATTELGDHFSGDLYEVLVVKTHLSPEECRALSMDRMRSHHVTPADAEPRILARP